MTLPVRYSPSGAVLVNANGGPFTPGTGARLRLAERNNTMTGTLAVPGTADFISAGGFGQPKIQTVLNLPKAGLRYRAKMRLDLVSNSSNVSAEVVLFLDTSVDGGTVFTNRAKVAHVFQNANSAGGGMGGQGCEIYLPLTQGLDLGVDDSVPTADIFLVGRAQLTVGTAGSVVVAAAATSGAVTGLDGSIHFELEECF